LRRTAWDLPVNLLENQTAGPLSFARAVTEYGKY